MLTQTFEHADATFTLRPPTIFDDEMYTSIWVGLCEAICTQKGIADLGSMPRPLQRLAEKCVRWLQVTVVTGKPYAHCSGGGVFSGIAVADFEAWQADILADNQALAVQWATAYKVVSDTKAVDEKKASGDESNGHQSEDLPSTVISAAE